MRGMQTAAATAHRHLNSESVKIKASRQTSENTSSLWSVSEIARAVNGRIAKWVRLRGVIGNRVWHNWEKGFVQNSDGLFYSPACKQLVGVTGSVVETGTMSMIALALQSSKKPVYQSHGNRNNRIDGDGDEWQGRAIGACEDG